MTININPHLANTFCSEIVFRLLRPLHIFKMHSRNFLPSNKPMNPDQTAPKGAVSSGFILFAIKAAQVHKQMRAGVVNSK